MAEIDVNLLKEKWNECLVKFRDNVSKESFDTWFSPIEPLSFDDETKVLVLGIPSDFFASRIATEYMGLYKITLNSVFHGLKLLNFKVKIIDAKGKKAEIEVPAREILKVQSNYDPTRRAKFQVDPHLNEQFTFDTYIEGDCNRGPRAIGNKIAENPGNNWNPMFIFGPSGLGKTHLAQAIGWKVKQLHPDKNVLYVSANQFMLQFQQAVINKCIPDFLNFYASLDFLIVDDIQELEGKEGTQSAFFNIFNQLQQTGRHVILTSDTLPKDLKTLDNRIISRFMSGYTGVLGVPDFQTKVNILNNELRKQGVSFTQDIVEYIAKNVFDNVRVLKGVIASICAKSIETGQPITFENARGVVDLIVGASEVHITIDDITDCVCRHYNLSVNDIATKCRRREVVTARQVAMFLARKYTACSLSDIGSMIGNRDHSTVIHAIRSVKDLLTTDKELSRSLATIEQELKY